MPRPLPKDIPLLSAPEYVDFVRRGISYRSTASPEMRIAIDALLDNDRMLCSALDAQGGYSKILEREVFAGQKGVRLVQSVTQLLEEAPLAIAAASGSKQAMQLISEVAFHLFVTATFFDNNYQLLARGIGPKPLAKLFHAATALLEVMEPLLVPTGALVHMFSPLRITIAMMRAFHHTFPAQENSLGVRPTPAMLAMLFRLIAAVGRSPLFLGGFDEFIGESLGFLLAQYSNYVPWNANAIFMTRLLELHDPNADPLIKQALWDSNPRPNVPDLMVGFARLLLNDRVDGQGDFPLESMLRVITIDEEVSQHLHHYVGYPGLMDYWCRSLRAHPLPLDRDTRDGVAVNFSVFVSKIRRSTPAMIALEHLPEFDKVVDFFFEPGTIRNSFMSALQTLHAAAANRLLQIRSSMEQVEAHLQVLDRVRALWCFAVNLNSIFL